MREKDSTQLLTHTDEDDEDDDDEKWWWWRRTTVWKYCVPNERGKSTGIDYWVAINAFIRDWRPCPQWAQDWWLRLLVSAQTEEGRGKLLADDLPNGCDFLKGIVSVQDQCGEMTFGWILVLIWQRQQQQATTITTIKELMEFVSIDDWFGTFAPKAMSKVIHYE